MPCGVVIKKEDDKLVIENPGSIRTGKKQMLRGGISDPRNKTIMKRQKQTTKTENHREKIRDFLIQTELASAREIAEIIGLSAERTRVILSKMEDIEPVGKNRNRKYKLKNKW